MVLGAKNATISIYIRVNEGGKQRFVAVNLRKPQPLTGTYYLRFEECGKRYWQRVEGDLAAAIAAKADLDTQRLCFKRAIAPKPRAAYEGKTLSKFRTEFLETKKLTRKKDGSVLDAETLTAYDHQTREFLSIAKAKYPDEITGNDLRRYMTALAERGLSHRSICNHYTSVGTFLLFCGIDHKTLLPQGERPSPDDGVPEAYTLEEVQNFLFRVPRERDRLFFEFALKSGGREREITTLEWSDLNLGHLPTVTFRAKKPHLKFRNKTGKGRAVPLEHGLVEKLIAWREKNPKAQLVFGTSNDNEDNHYLDVCKLVAFRAGLNCGRCFSTKNGKTLYDKKGKPLTCATHPVCSHWYLHKWRDTFCTWAIRRGVDLRTVQAWMGHTSIVMTERYMAPGEGKYAQEGINNTFAGISLDPEALRV